MIQNNQDMVQNSVDILYILPLSGRFQRLL